MAEKDDMRPGQLQPNELEVAILKQILADNPGLKIDIAQLHVLQRTYTGVGSYTTFQALEGKADRHVFDKDSGT